MMNRAVRGKSARTRSTTSATSAAPPPTRTVTPAGGASGPPGVRRAVTSALPSSRFGSVGRVERECREVVSGRRGEGGLDVAVARPVRVAVEERVLGQGQARIDVDEAVDARDVRIRRQPARVVVQRREVGRGRRGALGPDRQDDRRELALAELASEPVECGTRRHLRREDRGVGGIEPDVQER